MENYACGDCGAAAGEHLWLARARCPSCGADAIGAADGGGDGRPDLSPIVYGEVPMTACDAPMVRSLGGVPRDGALLLVTGPKGGGKSTSAAALVYALGRPAVWFDAEQDAHQLGALWERVGASRSWVEEHVRRVAPGSATWQRAAREVRSGRVEVWDSLHEWAPGESERGALVKRLRTHAHGAGRIVVAIAHFSASGHAFGASTTGHRGDLEIEVYRAGYAVLKCRFAPGPSSGWIGRDGEPLESALSKAERDRAPKAREGTASPAEAMPETCWSVLGIRSGAPADEIRAAWKREKAANSPDRVAHLSAYLRAAAEARSRAVDRAAEEALR